MTDPAQELRLTLSITEINLILEALGQRSYADVYRLIGKIQQQADRQFSESGEQPRHSDEELPIPDEPQAE